MAEHEPVTSPDQHKPGHPRAARAGAVVVALLLLSLIFENREGHVSEIWLVGGAALLLLALVGDWVLRRHGLR
ncbi:DUF2631 domain-containing protein [Dactylosporangium roseum]|uniref:DUF2631 domain-containing protein n=1 Tax=Dactylosporangium roseum TaxID=47989 RepID=A0ABY5YUL6_9ACTN|nr:DUF2631 domain-containing protein [Dactylosporangium roseum]UWZ33430.1 DUF2631 domain-containing protein [Dactylosporangium roseum]